VEKVSQLILDLMDKGVISPRQASALMRFVGESGFPDEKLSIVERLQTRAISFDEAIELLAGLAGDDEVAERARTEDTFWHRRRLLVLVFRSLMIITLILIFCTLHVTIPWTAQGLAQVRGASELTRRAVTFIQAVFTIVLAPGLALLWLESVFALLCAPVVLLPKVFTAKGTYDKILWLLGHVVGAAVALLAFYKMFPCDNILLQNVWLVLWIVCLGVPPVAFFWVGHPRKRGAAARKPKTQQQAVEGG